MKNKIFAILVVSLALVAVMPVWAAEDSAEPKAKAIDFYNTDEIFYYAPEETDVIGSETDEDVQLKILEDSCNRGREMLKGSDMSHFMYYGMYEYDDFEEESLSQTLYENEGIIKRLDRLTWLLFILVLVICGCLLFQFVLWMAEWRDAVRVKADDIVDETGEDVATKDVDDTTEE